MIKFFVFNILFIFISIIMYVTSIGNLYSPKLSRKYLTGHFIKLFIVIDSAIVCSQLLPNEVFYKNLFTVISGIPLVTVVNFILLTKKNRETKFYNFIIVFLVSMILIVSDNLSGNLCLYISNLKREEVTSNIHIMLIIYFINFLVSFTATKIIGIILRKIKLHYLYYKTKPIFKGVVSTNIILALFIMYFNAMLNKYFNTDKKVTTINVIMFSIYLIAALIAIFFYNSYLKKEMELENNKKEFENITQYTTLIENMYEETRKFKHDYMNILISLDGYIENGDMNLLKDYFYKHIITTQNIIYEKNDQIQRLKHIKQIPVKALVSSKLVKAQTEYIDITVDIFEDIENITMNIIDACRILGILFDNAIEACSMCYNPKIQFSMVKKDKSIIIILANSCPSDTPPIYKMFEKGFSTKGENRGLGLNNVKEIISEKYQNVILNTSMEDRTFKQELWIENTCN